MPETLTIAVCVCDGVTLSDFVPNMEILAGLNDADHPVLGKDMGEVRASSHFPSPSRSLKLIQILTPKSNSRCLTA
jgi:hypothetical protein